jgi:protein TonB
MRGSLRTGGVVVLVVLVHIALAAWLWQLPKIAKPEPVQLISMEWLDTPEPLPPVQTQTPTPPIEPLEPVIEPEPVLLQNEVAPPPPPPEQPKPMPKAQKVKPVEKKTPIAQPTTVQNEPISEQAELANIKLATEAAPAVAKPRMLQAQADYLNNPKPSYPRLSKRLGEQGEVRLKVQVGATGDVLMVELVKSSGFERLDEAALNAVKDWKFKPAKQGDEPVSSWVEVPVKFILEDA